tara:strand:- start:210 stop:596 length:387 start_codon:yes stop_codon:yes gene_type:complete
MAELVTKVKLFLESKGKTLESERENFMLQNDGGGPYIKEWNVVDEAAHKDKDGNYVEATYTKPTDDELDALESDADIEETSNEILANRQREYPNIQECVHAMLDNDNNELDALQAKRAEIKLKYPKGG